MSNQESKIIVVDRTMYRVQRYVYDEILENLSRLSTLNPESEEADNVRYAIHSRVRAAVMGVRMVLSADINLSEFEIYVPKSNK